MQDQPKRWPHFKAHILCSPVLHQLSRHMGHKLPSSSSKSGGGGRFLEGVEVSLELDGRLLFVFGPEVVESAGSVAAGIIEVESPMVDSVVRLKVRSIVVGSVLVWCVVLWFVMIEFVVIGFAVWFIGVLSIFSWGSLVEF